ncbi:MULTISPECIES: GreA/GreB family elongation factor [Flavobacteriaceae]|uniref:GreA/GreB family transcription elongation factor n=1 Tax=Meridianimaribacter flavus TaxID=571115 RepID=A0ABY2G8R3_9FLAO|nr:GreA/GreB family elongation factor [Meridianimaribacter flavus]TDY13511.1 GreA/GreB family transcription elongation factor [Meridianimaribacter flavus]
MNIKQELYSQCLNFVENRIEAIKRNIEEIQQSLLSETKSSAGDKHETGRAMIQLEREKAGEQLRDAEALKEVLFKVNPLSTTLKITLGSVVYTSDLNYFIAISAGQIRINGIAFFAISPQTPIGQKLTGKRIGDEVVFRDKTFKITKVE